MIPPKKIKKINESGNVAVILASGLGALAVIRALGKYKIPCIVIGQNYHHSSIYSTVSYNAETKADVEKYLFQIPKLINCKPVLFTDAEIFLDIIISNWNDLVRLYHLPLSRKNDLLINKEHIEKIDGIHRVSPIPISFEQIRDIREDQYPVIIKPLVNHTLYYNKNRPAKAYICSNERRALEVSAYLAKLNTLSVTQQLIEGDADTNYSILLYRSSNGKVEVGFSVKKLRIYPLDYGVSATIISEINNDLINQSIAIMELVDFNGIGEFEYKYCKKTNQYFLMEVNGRFPLQTGLLQKCNPGFIHLVYDDLKNGPSNQGISNKSLPNYVWTFFLNDMRAILGEYKRKNFKRMLKGFSLFRVQGAIWSFGDPIPLLSFIKYIVEIKLKQHHPKKFKINKAF